MPLEAPYLIVQQDFDMSGTPIAPPSPEEPVQPSMGLLDPFQVHSVDSTLLVSKQAILEACVREWLADEMEDPWADPTSYLDHANDEYQEDDNPHYPDIAAMLEHLRSI